MGESRMTSGDLRLALTAPVLVYGLARLWFAPIPWSVLVAAGAAAGALPLVLWSVRRPIPRALGLWPAALGAIGAVLVLPTWGAGPAVLELGIGLLLGFPLFLLALVAMHRSSLAGSVLLVPAALAVAAFSLAVAASFTGVGVEGAGAWAQAVHGVLGDQLLALAGSGTVSPPLDVTNDVVFDALGLLAFAGLLVSVLLSSERLPRLGRTSETEARTAGLWKGREEAPTDVADAAAFAVREVPSHAYQTSGVVSLAVALVATIGFLAATWSGTSLTLPGLAVMATVGLGLLWGTGGPARRRGAAIDVDDPTLVGTVARGGGP